MIEREDASRAARAPRQGSPELVRTRFGIEFDAREDSWNIDGRRDINMKDVRSMFGEELLAGAEMTFRRAATKYSWPTLHAFAWALKNYQKVMFGSDVIARWDIGELRVYSARLLKEFGSQDYLRHIRSFLANWRDGSWPGIEKDVVASLAEMRLKTAETGRAVRTMDPGKGPLSDEEFHHLLQSLNDAAERGTLDLEDYSLGYLHATVGRRPIQTAELKCRDLVMQISAPDAAYPNGRPLHILAIPRAKQRGSTFRESRRGVDLSPELFALFTAQRKRIQDDFRRVLDSYGWSLQERHLNEVLQNLPLYPAWTEIHAGMRDLARLRDQEGHGIALQALLRNASEASWHPIPKYHAFRIKSIYQTSSESDDLADITAQRLRYTKGTSLAREGFSTKIIAWLLDHSNDRNANIYVDNLPEHAAQVSGALSKSVTLNRVVQAFRGTLVDSETEARGGDDPRSRVAYKGKAGATCGQMKQCGLDGGVPHACYTCSHFQPWLDGPHEQFLADLLAERADSIEVLGANSAVAKRRDTLITAVENVVQLCRARRAELAATGAST